MSRFRTIFSNTDYDEVLSYIGNLGVGKVEDDEIKTYEINFPEGNLQISIKKRVEDGDGFSRMIGGTWNFFRTIETERELQKKELLNRILECKTAVGVVADSDFTETDARATFIFKLMKMFDGVMFDGQGMIDENGKIILDYDGSSELA